MKFGCLCQSHTLGITLAYPWDGDTQNACCVGWGTGMGLVSVSKLGDLILVLQCC